MSILSDLNELLLKIVDDDAAYVVGGPKELDQLAWRIMASLDRKGQLDSELRKYL